MSFSYSRNVSEEVCLGHVFVISGTVLPEADRINITLTDGKPNCVSAVLHLSIRFDEDIIVRNTMVNSIWGAEERLQNLDKKADRMPIKPGDYFKVCISVECDNFLISVNDKAYCSYKFRLPISHIKAIIVEKDVATLNNVDHVTDDKSFNFRSHLFGQACIGHVFEIGGTVLPQADRVDITFTNGNPDGVCVPLHLSVRFCEDIIVRNSMIDGMWGAEERMENLDTNAVRMPLQKGDYFKVYIFVGNDRFLISVNDMAYCSYKYRLSISDIRMIVVGKDVDTLNQMDHRSVFPMPCPTVLVHNPEFDFSNDIPMRFRVGHKITITGIPIGNIHGRFVVSFFDGDKEALHFNPRFMPQNCVAINTQNDDLSWQHEERHNIFPFAIGNKFQLQIVLSETEFQFTVNGMAFACYKYRSNNLLDRLNGLKIKGKDGIRVRILGIDHVTA